MLLTGLIGRPVGHSIGQTVYNRFYASSGIDSIYISVDVVPENLERFVAASRDHFLGFNVTIPHKVSILDFLDHIDREAEGIGAVNLVRIRDGRTYGYNTDYMAMMRLGKNSGIEFDSSRVAVMGTGGVSRTVLYYLARNHPNAEVTVFSRDPGSASSRLPEYMLSGNCRIRGIGESPEEVHDILINCSPVGMWPDDSKSPFSEKMIKGCRAGIDLVYNPVETKFIRKLKGKGKVAVNGAGFFIDQGLESLKIFFGEGIDEAAFMKIAEQAIMEKVQHG